MNQSTIDLATKILSAVLLLAVLAGVFALAWHKSISGGAALSLATTIVVGALAAFAYHAGAVTGAAASQQQPPPASGPPA